MTSIRAGERHFRYGTTNFLYDSTIFRYGSTIFHYDSQETYRYVIYSLPSKIGLFVSYTLIEKFLWKNLAVSEIVRIFAGETLFNPKF